jgi:hypothetical protein
MQTAQLTDVGTYVILVNPYGVFLGHNINMVIWNAMPKRIQEILTEEVEQSAEMLIDFLIM